MFEKYFEDLSYQAQQEPLSYAGVNDPKYSPLLQLTLSPKKSNSGLEGIEVMAEMKEMQNLVENFVNGI